MLTAHAVRATLSPARMATYEQFARSVGGSAEDALALYAWNARVCGALLVTLHICEVAIRNAVGDALASTHGPQWPWNTGFERSLPRQNGPGYNALGDLQRVRNKSSAIGQVIAELKFVFWEKMFTSRHDDRIWRHCLAKVLPNLDPTMSNAAQRKRVFDDLNQVRLLRNRIAHHEPIFSRDLLSDFNVIYHLVVARCDVSAQWLLDQQQVLEVIATKPI